MNPLVGGAVDAPKLAEAMRSHGLHVVGRLNLSRVGFGQSNLTYAAVDEQGNRWIARRPPLGELLASAHDVEREYRILAALNGSVVPVPGVKCLVASGIAAEVPVVVMEYIDGQVIEGFEGLDELSSVVRTEFVQQLSSVLVAVHAVDIVSVGLAGLASHAAYAPRQLKRWSAQWGRSRTQDLPTLDALTDLLHRNAPEQARLTLIHGDFSPRNVIVDPSRGVIRAVLDWELSTLGDPLADVGTVLAYWTLADMAAAGAGSMAASVPAIDERSAFVRAYLEGTGDTATQVGYWHALGLWKLAIIAEGVIKRAVNEPSNASATGAPDPADVARIIEIALEIVADPDRV